MTTATIVISYNGNGIQAENFYADRNDAWSAACRADAAGFCTLVRMCAENDETKLARLREAANDEAQHIRDLVDARATSPDYSES